jgi:hypothetical protein
MAFIVEQHEAGTWVVAAEVRATRARQAVARASSEASVYRAGPTGTMGLYERFPGFRAGGLPSGSIRPGAQDADFR